MNSAPSNVELLPRAAEQAVGVAVALFVAGGADLPSIGFVQFSASLKAGHATQPRRSVARRTDEKRR